MQPRCTLAKADQKNHWYLPLIIYSNYNKLEEGLG